MLGRMSLKNRRIGRLVAAQLLLTCPFLAAQESELKPGARVRVNRKAVGSLVSWDANGLALADTAFALSQVNSVELSRGPKSNAGKGAWIGALGGAAAGATYGLVLCEGECDAGSFAAAVVWGLPGAAAGALVGLVIGLAIPGERWEDIVLPSVRTEFDNGEASIALSVML